MIDQLKQIFLFNSETPLIFTRLYFWGFFLVVMVFFSLVYKRKPMRNVYLWLVSMFFYYKTGGLFLILLFFVIVIDFFIGLAIYHARLKNAKTAWLTLSLTITLSVLAFFKYDLFFTETINTLLGTNFEVINHGAAWSNLLLGTHFDIGKLLPPVGISFFVFQTMSYIIDVYRGDLKPVTRLADYGFFVSFFPQLVAGPIVRASQFIPQLYKDFSLSREEFGMAIFMILRGLVKKLFIGDFIALNLIDRVFANPVSYTGFENLMGLYGYSLQVYCDFSGYTDMAIGLALLMGFHLPENFNSPYKAKSCGEFWKRWHISLSTWLKDYLYIPMGGNRGASPFTYISLSVLLIVVVLLSGKLYLAPVFAGIMLFTGILMKLFPAFRLNISTNINLMMTMLIGGLWHGASWMFIIWGGLNGLGVVVYKLWRKISPWEQSNHWAATFWKIFITFNFITFTRIWFRGESMQGTVDLMNQVAHNFGWAQVPAMLLSYWKVFAIMALGYVLHWLSYAFKNKWMNRFIAAPLYAKIIISAVVVFVVYQSLSAGLQPFIYFQF
ncbi:MAG: MBOAT family protein [Bacteroidales bacterium]|nr:MBOAT family protein [Bacteroidales bacterium]